KEDARKLVEEQVFARWPLYAGSIARAQTALERGDALSVRQALLRNQPAKEERDLRGFEWYYLWRQIHRERFSLGAQRATVLCLTVSSDSSTFASGGADGSIKLWETATGQLKADLRGHKGPVHALSFSPSGKHLASAGADGVIRLWDGNAGAADFA